VFGRFAGIDNDSPGFDKFLQQLQLNMLQKL
jgi:hypothetical protein